MLLVLFALDFSIETAERQVAFFNLIFLVSNFA